MNLPADVQASFAAEIMAVLAHPEFAPIFGAGSRAEVPVVGLVAGKDAGANINLRYRLTDHWMIAATGGYTRLLNDAKDAPLVRLRGSFDQWQGGIFVAYRF